MRHSWLYILDMLHTGVKLNSSIFPANLEQARRPHSSQKSIARGRAAARAQLSRCRTASTKEGGAAIAAPPAQGALDLNLY